MNNIRLLLPLLIILIAPGCTPEGKQKIKPVKAEVEIKQAIINDNFGGVGFNVFDHMHKASRWNYEQVFAKRWRELNPSFARVPDDCRWDFRQIDQVSWFLDVLKETNTEIYMTTFHNTCLKKGKNEQEYVKKEVDNLEYLKKNKGFSNITYYCMANELSLGEWASMTKDRSIREYRPQYRPPGKALPSIYMYITGHLHPEDPLKVYQSC